MWKKTNPNIRKSDEKKSHSSIDPRRGVARTLFFKMAARTNGSISALLHALFNTNQIQAVPTADLVAWCISSPIPTLLIVPFPVSLLFFHSSSSFRCSVDKLCYSLTPPLPTRNLSIFSSKGVLVSWISIPVPLPSGNQDLASAKRRNGETERERE